MDLTPVFKASVMAVKMRKKDLPKPDKNRILHPKPKDEFSKQAKEVCKNITAVRDLLLESRAAYMKFAYHLKSSAHMTDEQRDLIDREAERIFTYYTQFLNQLRSNIKGFKAHSKQHMQHIELVIDILSNYLRAVQNLHLSQKKYRMEYELDTIRFLKLVYDKKKIPVMLGKPYPVNGLHRKTGLDDEEDDIDDVEESCVENVKSKHKTYDTDSDDEKDEDIKSLSDILDKGRTEEKKVTSPKKVALDEANNESIYEDSLNELTPEDIQMFESENIQLYNELQGLAEEVDQIEKNVVDIARLQEIFTEKVVSQKQDIERISDAVVGTTENLKDANEQIKQAIQRNAGLRVWTLFFLLVISFTLLFLDWYND